MAVDLSDPATIQDPYPAYAWLREHAPVHRWELDGHPRGGMWMVSRHADARAMMADDRCTKRGARVGVDEAGAPPIMMFLDPPEHTRVRRPAAATFTRRRVAALRDEVAEDVARLVAPLVAGDPVDVVADVAMPLPLDTIIRLLGLRIEDGPYLHGLTQRILDAVDAGTSDDAEDAVTADALLQQHMRDHVARRRDRPADDLTSAMLAQPELDDTDVALLCTQLLVNGHETTVNLIGTGLWTLLSHRDQWDRLVADPSLVDGAVEECLRFDAPNQRTSSRFTLEPIEVAGTTIPAGEQVTCLIGAANRDGDVFASPDAVDVGRAPNPHLSFGHGRHHCPGAALTRLEFATLLRHLVTRAPDLDVVGGPPRYRPNSFDRGLETLVLRRGG